MNRFILIITLIVSIMSFSNSVYAETEVDIPNNAIRSAVEEDYKLHFAGALQAAKEDFNSNGETSFAEAKLGEGVAYYRVSESEFPFVFAGYIFPIIVNGKKTALIQAHEVNSKWKVFIIGNSVDIEEQYQQVRMNNKEASQIKLIDDRAFDIQGVYLKDSNGEKMIDFKSDQVRSLIDIKNEVMEKKKAISENKGNFGGAGQPEPSSSGVKIPYMLLAIVICFLIPPVYLISKRRRF